MANPYVLDWSPITNALASYQKQKNADREFSESGRRWESQNYLAQEQLGIQKQGAARQQAEYDRQNEVRGGVTNWLSNNPNVGGVPQPLVDLARIQSDPSGVQNYILAEAKRKATLNGPEEFGKAGSVFQGQDGKFYTVQFGSKGQRNIMPVETGGQPLTPAKGVGIVGDEMYDSATGLPRRNVAPQIAGKEAAEKIGEARGQAVADLPRKQMQAEGILKTVRQIREHPGLGGNFGVSGAFPNIPGGQSANANTLIEQMRGKAFLEAFNQLRGGGAITEAEGQKATVSLIRAQNAQSKEAFIEALADFEYSVMTGMELARRQAGIGGPNGNVGVSPNGGFSIRRLD